MNYFHSVTLDTDKCHGCTNCIGRCPTEAIRVQKGKAKIINDRCIDCGECIKICQSHAKTVRADSFADLEKFKYNIAMPAPSFYSQFRSELGIDKILTAFLEIGFNDVFEVSRGAEYVSSATRQLLASEEVKKPIISSACPATVRLIQERFPELIPNLLKIISPMEAAAKLARQEAIQKTGLKKEEIGIFFISPCPAKVTSVKAPLTLEKSNVDGVIPSRDAFAKIRPFVEGITEIKKTSVSGSEGVFWATSGGESLASGVEDYMAVDGIHNVIQVLEEIEYGKVNSVKFVELSACTGGCSGGALNLVNPFLASRRTVEQIKTCPKTQDIDLNYHDFIWQKEVNPAPTPTLSDNLSEAMQKMEEIDKLYERLPKLDCGSCGAPSCRAFAEDVVRGFANESDCIPKMKEHYFELLEKIGKTGLKNEDINSYK